eukprot:TRINITY_DN23795_c0_g1_i1.p1 TRINITY_DN23795_c0_g1~~TRINITY_DN23795_c0_g1_i1.p1  ORF type:complete len:250 (+),score=60.38 TRINITY_DN23795_c0_g1_i1:91-840(+)
MIRRPPRSTLSSSSAASDVYKRQLTSTMSAQEEPPAPQPGICNAYLKGKCHRGKACRFVHDRLQKKAKLLATRDKRFDSESEGEDDADAPVADVTKGPVIDEEERNALEAERKRQMEMLMGPMSTEPEAKTVSFHHGTAPKKRTHEDSEKAAAKQARREKNKAAKEALQQELETSALSAAAMSSEWDEIRKMDADKKLSAERKLEEEIARRKLEVHEEVGEEGLKEAADLWAEFQQAQKPKKKRKPRHS